MTSILTFQYQVQKSSIFLYFKFKNFYLSNISTSSANFKSTNQAYSSFIVSFIKLSHLKTYPRWNFNIKSNFFFKFSIHVNILTMRAKVIDFFLFFKKHCDIKCESLHFIYTSGFSIFFSLYQLFLSFISFFVKYF